MTSRGRLTGAVAVLLAGTASLGLWIASYRARQLTFGDGSEAYPVVSSDGQWIAYERIQDDNPDGTEIWIMSAKSGFQTARRISRPGQWSSGPSWSPDSRWVSFVSKRVLEETKSSSGWGMRVVDYQISKVNIVTGEMLQLTHFPDSGIGPHLASSRTGRIAFTLNADGDIYAVRDDGSSLTRLFKVQSAKPTREVDFPTWSPDSRRLAFDVTERLPHGGETSTVWVGDVASGRTRQLSFGETDCCPSWLDDDRIVFCRGVRSGMKVNVAMLDFKTGSVISLTRGFVDWLPHATPDGSRILFSRVKDVQEGHGFNFLFGSHLFEKRLPHNRIEAALFSRY